MLRALVDGVRQSPQPRLRGVCPFCDGPAIAKCGPQVRWHWAHKANACDPWWENETEWHRAWKTEFPPDWQEVVAYDPATGERHIADVKAPAGHVIEFQRSTIKPEEVAAREAFYSPMAWVVDGTRNEFDSFYFGISRMGQLEDDPSRVNIHWMGRGGLLTRWCRSRHRVYLDFGGQILWLIEQFDPTTKKGLVRKVNRDEFIRAFIGGTNP